MAFNVNEMLGVINQSGGFTKASKYTVTITPPANLYGDVNASFTYLCESASLPGVSFQTDDVKIAGYGLTEKRAVAPVFTDVNLSFFCDANGAVYKFFHKWMQSVYNFNMETGTNAVSSSGLALNALAYPADYYGRVNIEHFDDKAKSVVKWTLEEAYPIAIGDVQVAWAMSDTLTILPVSFVFKAWTSSTLDPGNVTTESDTNATTLPTNPIYNNFSPVSEIPVGS